MFFSASETGAGKFDKAVGGLVVRSIVLYALLWVLKIILFFCAFSKDNIVMQGS